MYSLRKLVLAVLLALVPGLLVALPVAEAGKAMRADLVVKAFKVPKKVTQGSTLRVTLKVRNASRKKAARKSVTRVYLSTDRKRGKDISLAKVRTPKVPKGKTKKKVVKLRVAKRVKARRYWVIACADATKKVKETREGNNCRTSKNKVKVVAKKKTPPATGFPRRANPIDVQVFTAGTGSVTDTLYGNGDSIEMTAPDGTHYELAFPLDFEKGGALLNGVDVTLTPVTRIRGNRGGAGPFSTFHAVDIQPHGLMLLRPATLTVTPPLSSPSARRMTAFSADYSGADLHLTPSTVGGGSIDLPVNSFSTHGVTPTADPGVDVVASHTPRDPMAQFGQRGRDILQEGGPDTQAKMQALMDEAFTDHLQPQLEASLTDPALREIALQEALSTLRTMELLGMDVSKWSPYVMEMLEKILKLDQEESITRCVEQGELAMVTRVLGLQRTMAVLGMTGDEGDPEAKRRLLGCLRFELTFTSEIERESVLPLEGHTVGETTNGTYATKVDRMVLELDNFLGTVSGRGEIHYTDYSLSMVRTNPPSGDKPCLFQETHTGIGTEAGVASAWTQMDVNYYRRSADRDAPPPPQGPVGTLAFEVGTTLLDLSDPSDHVLKEPTERFKSVQRDTDCNFRPETQHTARSWMAWTVAKDQLEREIWLNEWNGSVLHKSTWDLSEPKKCGGCTVDTRTEYATLTLEHAPQR